MNQIQILGIIRKNKKNILTGKAVQIPMIEIEYLAEHEKDEYSLERIHVILDKASLASWAYASKGTLVYVIGRGIGLNDEVVVAATNILLVRDRTGRQGTALLFQYGVAVNQFFMTGNMRGCDKMIVSPVRVRGSLHSYSSIPVIFEERESADCEVSAFGHMISGKPSRNGVVVSSAAVMEERGG